MILDICFSPILFPYYKSDEYSTVVIIDVFRASTTICTALNNGASSIIPVENLDEVEALKLQGFLVGGERNVERCSFADFGNSPFEYTEDKVLNNDIAFSTTNGTRAIGIASKSAEVIIGSFVNLNKTIDYCGKNQKGVLILCSGWKNKFNIEDTLCGGAIVDGLIKKYGYAYNSDSVQIVIQMWKNAKDDLKSYLKNSEHYNRLITKDLEKDIEYCLSLNAVNVLPKYNADTNRITL